MQLTLRLAPLTAVPFWQIQLCIYSKNTVPQKHCRLSPATGIGYAKNCVFCCFQYFLSQFCVNKNGDLKLWGWVGWKKKSSTRLLSLRAVFCLEGFGTVSDWLVQVCCVWRGELTCFSSQCRLVPQKSLGLGSGEMPWCFRDSSFWMQDLSNKIVLSSVWYYMLIITV